MDIRKVIEVRSAQVKEACDRVQSQIEKGKEIAQKAEESVKESRQKIK